MWAKELHPKEWRLQSPQSLVWGLDIKSYLRHHTVYCSLWNTKFASHLLFPLPNSSLSICPQWVMRNLYVGPVNSACSPLHNCVFIWFISSTTRLVLFRILTQSFSEKCLALCKLSEYSIKRLLKYLPEWMIAAVWFRVGSHWTLVT
jgi:hypothetical protein